ncbi:MAG: hypothetical protein ACUVQU_05545, partial [Candidatus Bipolaricaulia bacterium]
PGLGFPQRTLRLVGDRLGGLLPESWAGQLRHLTKEERAALRRTAPNVINTLILASVVLQRQIVELSLRLSPPEVLIRPEFAENPPRYHQAERGIKAGEAAAREAIPQIERVIRSRPGAKASQCNKGHCP